MKIGGSKSYWILQVIGWGIYFIAGLLISRLYPIYDFKKAVIFQIISYFIMIGTTHFIRYLMMRYRLLALSWTRLIPSILAINLFCAIVVNSINSLIMFYLLNMFENQTFSFAALGMYIFQMFVFFSLWTSIYIAIHFFRNYKSQEIEKWKLEAAVKDAELIALKSQINPHFIFNSLNNIRSLVSEDGEKARDMITHLSTLLRYSIQFSNQELVSLEDEIDIVKDYLKLESIQLENRLEYKITVPEEARNVKIPPMTIQLLVENAIKHGINLLPSGGEIIVNAAREGEILRIEVLNSGQITAHRDNIGIGLKNASERLELLFGKLSDLRIYNKDEDLVAASFSVPI